MRDAESTPGPDARTATSRETKIIGHFIGEMWVDTTTRAPRIGRGNLAALRRMDPDAYDVPAFWRLLALATDGAMVTFSDEEARWALIAHGMALMAPSHFERIEIGKALHAVGYTEGRLARLLGARGPQFRALVPRLCRHLAASQQPLDWYAFARLILTEGRNEAMAEDIRRRIASHYYAAEVMSATAAG